MRSLFVMVLVSACSSSVTVDGGAMEAGVSEAAIADVSVEAGGCGAALEQALSPIDAVSTGEVTMLSSSGNAITIYVDASAGGTMMASMNPRIYITLDGSKAMLTDKSARESKAWDLALKRPILFTNSGHGGPGHGGAVLVDGKDFDAVTSADATGKSFKSEVFVDQSCTPQTDSTGALKTSFDGWYDYNMTMMTLAPHAGTWLVKSASGKLYKLQILGYYATTDGGMGMSGGRYILKVAPL